jgi:hypothetical protein
MIHDGNGNFMLQRSAAKQAFLLSPQSSALSPYFPYGPLNAYTILSATKHVEHKTNGNRQSGMEANAL